MTILKKYHLSNSTSPTIVQKRTLIQKNKNSIKDANFVELIVASQVYTILFNHKHPYLQDCPFQL